VAPDTLHTHFSFFAWEMVRQSSTTSSKAKRGVDWTMNYSRGAERFTHALLFFTREWVG
jgi:hypothetical protein